MIVIVNAWGMPDRNRDRDNEKMRRIITGCKKRCLEKFAPKKKSKSAFAYVRGVAVAVGPQE